MTLIEDLGLIYATDTSKEKKRHGMFKCECGSTNRMPIASAKKAKVCQLCNVKNASKTHGDSNTKLHNTWKNMKARCYSKNHMYYNNYGGRGITICEEWRTSYEAFKKWAVDNGYEEELTIDRKENDGNYEPSNCRWVTMEVQSRNRRVICSVNTSGYKGITKTTGSSSWNASISVSNKKIHIGTFPSKKEAAIAYNQYVTNNGLEHTINEIH